MSFNVEQKFYSILRRYGHNVFLQRVLNTEKGNEAPRYSNKLEQWTTYSLMPGGSSGISHTAEENQEGLMYDVDMIFYFQAKVNPASGDRIYEEVDRLPNKEAVYSVDFAQPLRGVGGRIIYWTVGATRIEPK